MQTVKNIGELISEVRYAIRVLERQARFWRRLDIIVRLISFVSLTSAFGALLSSSAIWTLFFGVALVLFQAVDFVLVPATRVAEAKEAIRHYKPLLSAEDLQISAARLQSELEKARSDDSVTAFESIRVLAFNDICREIGHGDQQIQLNSWQRLMGKFA